MVLMNANNDYSFERNKSFVKGQHINRQSVTSVTGFLWFVSGERWSVPLLDQVSGGVKQVSEHLIVWSEIKLKNITICVICTVNV